MKVTCLFLAAVFASVMGSCNTMIGLGRDMRIMGEQMENTSNKARGQQSVEDPSGAPIY